MIKESRGDSRRETTESKTKELEQEIVKATKGSGIYRRGKESLSDLKKTVETLASREKKRCRKRKQISGKQYNYEGTKRVISSSTRQYHRSTESLDHNFAPSLVSTSGISISISI